MRKVWQLVFLSTVALPIACMSGTGDPNSEENGPGVPICTGGYSLCGSACVDLLGDGQNCGACGTTCSQDQVCSRGTCQDTCTDAGRTRCDDSCVEVGSNPSHCGGCGIACSDGQTCQSGGCVGETDTGSGGVSGTGGEVGNGGNLGTGGDIGSGGGGVGGAYATEVVLEEGELGQCDVDGLVESTNGGFTGNGYLNSDNVAGASIEWAVDVGQAGTYSLQIAYASESEDRTADVLIGDTVALPGVSFAPTASWTTWATTSVDVELGGGENRIALRATTAAGLANIDSLTVTGASVRANDCSEDVGTGGSGGGTGGSGGNEGGTLAEQYPCDGSTEEYDHVVTGSGSNWRVNSVEHPSLIAAIRAALGDGGADPSNMRTVLVADGGNVPDEQIRVFSNTLINVCGELNVVAPSAAGDRAPIYARSASNIVVPHLTVRGIPPYGVFFRDVDNVEFGEVDIRISGGLGMRIDNNPSGNGWANSASNSTRRAGFQLDSAYVDTVSHGVELYGIDGVTIGTVVARNASQAGLMLNNSRNVEVGLVDGQFVSPSAGYAVFRMANDNGKDWESGTHPMSIHVGKVIARESGGNNGQGIFCLTDSGGVTIDEIDIENTASSSIWLEWCTNVTIGNPTTPSRIHNSGGVLISYDPNSDTRRSNDLLFQNIAITGTGIDATHTTCPPSLQWINVTSNGSPVTGCP